MACSTGRCILSICFSYVLDDIYVYIYVLCHSPRVIHCGFHVQCLGIDDVCIVCRIYIYVLCHVLYIVPSVFSV